jgi:hypothetical protein
MKTLRFELYRLTRRMRERGLVPQSTELYDSSLVNAAQSVLDESQSCDDLADRWLLTQATRAAYGRLEGVGGITRVEPARMTKTSQGALLLDIPVKTARAPGGCYEDDCDGTYPPGESADEAAKSIQALIPGLGAPEYEVCEKGWGDYYFEIQP